MGKTVIEISVIAETEGDEDAARIGEAVVRRASLAKQRPEEFLLLRRVEQVTVANIDHDFLAE